MNEQTKLDVNTDVKISFWKSAAFGLGDFGNNFVWTFVGSYLMIFYTDVFPWRRSPC